MANCYSMQAKRLEHVATRMKAIDKKKAKESSLQQMEDCNSRTMQVVMDAIAIHDQEAVDTTHNAFRAWEDAEENAQEKVAEAARHHKDKAKTYRRRADAAKKKERKEDRQDGSKGQGKISKALNQPPAQPILYLSRDKPGPRGQPIGSTTTDPKEIDRIVRHAWNSIYSGNVTDRMI